MEEGDYNVFLNLLNVFYRISDKEFIAKEWQEERKVEEITSIIYSYREAYEIIDDYSMFEILDPDFGCWKDVVQSSPVNVVDALIKVATEVINFREFDWYADQLLQHPQWIRIMDAAKKAYFLLRDYLKVTDNAMFLL